MKQAKRVIPQRFQLIRPRQAGVTRVTPHVNNRKYIVPSNVKGS